ncbi:MAG TPA: helix-hairpin-helix domain-containing protein [Candidatus Cloacimonadota bacterium]|nr:helix-hairpin-helix domain-containing protein [Candidatus Cloacimonadota bacterium]
MRNPLSSILTPSEQKALLFLLICFFAGSLLNRLGFPAISPLAANKDAHSTDLESFEDSLQTDVIPIIDIRTATLEELILLPGIGEKRAQQIIEHRRHSPFQNVNEIMLIKGIGLKTYEKMRPLLLVFGSDALIDKNSTSASTSSKKESESSKESVKKADLTTMVNLNTATLEQLCTLVGIGPAKAQAILDYRAEHGDFTAIEDIMKVKGIGPATFAKNKDRLEI